MKVGSLVEVIDASDLDWCLKDINIGQIFTVRGFSTGIAGLKQLYLEEIINEFHLGREPGYGIFRFRELLPPEEIAEVIEEANEVLKEREVVV